MEGVNLKCLGTISPKSFKFTCCLLSTYRTFNETFFFQRKSYLDNVLGFTILFSSTSSLDFCMASILSKDCSCSLSRLIQRQKSAFELAAILEWALPPRMQCRLAGYLSFDFKERVWAGFIKVVGFSNSGLVRNLIADRKTQKENSVEFFWSRI